MKIKYVSVIYLTQYLEMSKSKIYQMAKDNEIPFYRIKGSIRFNLDDVDRWIENNCELDFNLPTLPKI
jgi:excisionase family DNA binding protein